MNDANAAQAAAVGALQECAQRVARCVAAQAVQVELILDGPMAFAQFTHHIGTDAAAGITQAVVGIEQRFGVEIIR